MKEELIYKTVISDIQVSAFHSLIQKLAHYIYVIGPLLKTTDSHLLLTKKIMHAEPKHRKGIKKLIRSPLIPKPENLLLNVGV